ncbi:MAG: polyhydroxyalkanoic acid system family protein [Proteobacteria bacterium]|nr:polyhydroxyalkanoic acid system family protein [Pseudomonadota bacterium]
MSTIDIRRKHGKSLKAARTAVDKTAGAIGKKFAIASEWDGDTLHFSRSGVNGRIHVGKTELRVHAELGFLLGMMKPAIEEEIHRQLDENFG